MAGIGVISLYCSSECSEGRILVSHDERKVDRRGKKFHSVAPTRDCDTKEVLRWFSSGLLQLTEVLLQEPCLE